MSRPRSEPPVVSVAPPGSALYYVLQSLPQARREIVRARFALHQELHTLAFHKAPEIRHARAAWWYEELGRWRSGRPRHPITRALAATTGSSEDEHIEQLFRAVSAVKDPAQFTSRRELLEYCEQAWSYPLRELIEPGEPLRRLSHAHGACQFVVDFGRHLKRQAVLFPEQTRALANPDGEQRRRFILAQIEYVLTLLEQAEPEFRPELAPAGIMVALDRGLLRELLRDPLQILESKVQLTPLRLALLSWRTRRRFLRPK